MNRLKRKLAVNGVATILSAIFILAMVAGPILADTDNPIVDRSIQTIDLALGAVKTGVLGNNSITSAKIKDRQVKTADLAVGAVGVGRIKNGAVTGPKIRDYSIAKEKLRSSSVNSVKIADGSIVARDIADSAVNSAKIANGSILGSDIADGTLTNADIADGTIGNADLADNAVNSAKIADGQVTSADIAPNTITHDDIAVNTIWSSNIMDNQIRSIDIRNSEITNADISPSAGISDSKISYSQKTGYLALPPSALNPTKATTWKNDKHLSMISGGGYFNAPVLLPQDAVITKLRYQVSDSEVTASSKAWLYRINSSVADPDTLGETAGTGNQGFQELFDDTISNDPVNNSKYAYYVQVWLTNPGVYARKIIIEYTYTTPGG